MYSARGGPITGSAMSLEDQKHDLLESTDSGTVDSGFHSGGTQSSDSISSSCEQRGNASTATYQHRKIEDSQENDSGGEFCSSDPMPMNDLCTSLQQMQLNRQVTSHLMKWRPYFEQNDDGDSYLHMAIIHEDVGFAETLIRVAVRPWLDTQNDIGQTPLHLAVLTKQPKIVRQLIVAGAKPDIRDIDGNTALHLACLYRRNECTKALLTPLGVPQYLEQWNYNGQRCVHIAAETSNVEVLRNLISAGADINSREGKAGLTPLHIAIESGNGPLVNFLLEECPKLRLEQVTYAGLTAYQLAAIQHNQMLQKRLQKNGAEPLTPPESDYEFNESSDEEEGSFYGSNTFMNNFSGLSTVNVAAK